MSIDTGERWLAIGRGSVRIFISVSLTLCTLYMAIVGTLSADIVATAFVSLASYYFGERAGLKVPGGGE